MHYWERAYSGMVMSSYTGKKKLEHPQFFLRFTDVEIQSFFDWVKEEENKEYTELVKVHMKQFLICIICQ